MLSLQLLFGCTHLLFHRGLLTRKLLLLGWLKSMVFIPRGCLIFVKQRGRWRLQSFNVIITSKLIKVNVIISLRKRRMRLTTKCHHCLSARLILFIAAARQGLIISGNGRLVRWRQFRLVVVRRYFCGIGRICC